MWLEAYLNTLTYAVEFEDEDVRECMVNAIDENMLARADSDFYITMSLNAMLNHKTIWFSIWA